jgi:pimeloyl-ACP methyl ester carboxylesterase
MNVPDRRRGVVEAADGTPIAFHTHGMSNGPVVVLSNGIGTTENFWRHLVAALATDHTVVHWDYRGHGSTPLAVSGAYSLATLADDLARVTRRVQAPGGPPPVHIGFSMGVAVLLRMYRAHPGLVRAMSLIAGAPDAPGVGTPLFRLPGSQLATRAVVAAATPVVPLVFPLVRAFLRSRLPIPMAKAVGVLQPHAPKEDIDLFLTGLSKMNPLAYWATLRSLLAERGSDVLPGISVPVSIIAAEDDLLMPLVQVENMRRALPQAHYVLIPQAGHAGLVEKGPEMAQAVRSWMVQLTR